ncbi:MAG: transposase [Terriglobia bacterium]
MSPEASHLIRKMAEANPLWGAPRIHGELLKLGINVSERTVSRLMPKRLKSPSQTWKAFLNNHIQDLVSIDFFTVPTATFRVLFVLVVLAHHRSRTHLGLAKDTPEPRAVQPPEMGDITDSIIGEPPDTEPSPTVQSFAGH